MYKHGCFQRNARLKDSIPLTMQRAKRDETFIGTLDSEDALCASSDAL